MDKNKHDFMANKKLALLWVIFGVLGRLIPHFPNVTPMTSLCLFCGSKLSRLVGFLSLLLTLFVSDLLLALILGYPIFSMWTLFTYSGFAVIMLISSKLKYSARILPGYLLASSLGFWLWTNFGVWLTSAIYTKSFVGLIACYTAALPFLRNAIIGDLLWGAIIFGSYSLVQSKISKQRLALLNERA